MKLQNIHNKGRFVYLFERLDNGEQKITEVKDFYPYYYEPHPTGTLKSYDGKTIKKMVVSNPTEVGKIRSEQSYESDILYPKRYIIDRIPKFDVSPIKYLFIDIEILATKLPDIRTAEFPISCVTIYNSFTKQYSTWYLPDFANNEELMLEDLILYIKEEAPDILLAWNIEFDYTYFHNRIRNFPALISPIGMVRLKKVMMGVEEHDIWHPAGISIVDYKGLYEKLTLSKKRSYALDYIAQEDLGEQPWQATKFNVIDETVKAKNINDVKRMVRLEEKFKVVSLFDEIRRFAHCYWEDLPTKTIRKNGRLEKQSDNSKIIDMLVLREAKKRGFILPKKQQSSEEKTKFEGAYREDSANGRFFNIGKYDLSGAYLYAVIDLCLDSRNIELNPSSGLIPVKITDRKTSDVIQTYHLKQDDKALLPTVIKELLIERNKYRDLLKSTPTDSPDYDMIDQKYKAMKTIVLSCWGVIGNQYFRLYDSRVASMITSIVRDVLHYVKEEMEKLGYQIIYLDTDSMFCVDNGVNISDVLNGLIQKWAQDRFGKKSSINFEYEGHFTRLLLLTKCRYVGYLKSAKGEKQEIKGIEAKKISASIFESKFQKAIIDKVLNKESKESIVAWILKECDAIKNVSPKEIAFPFKIKSDNYKREPIFARALNNTKDLFPDFTTSFDGDILYYAYMKPYGCDKNGKERNVIAFTENFNVFKNPKYPLAVDWDEAIRRNIISKAEEIFEVMNWGNLEYNLVGQTSLF